MNDIQKRNQKLDELGGGCGNTSNSNILLSVHKKRRKRGIFFISHE